MTVVAKPPRGLNFPHGNFHCGDSCIVDNCRHTLKQLKGFQTFVKRAGTETLFLVICIVYRVYVIKRVEGHTQHVWAFIFEVGNVPPLQNFGCVPPAAFGKT